MENGYDADPRAQVFGISRNCDYRLGRRQALRLGGARPRLSASVLGVGEKDVAIPFKELRVSTRDGKDWLVLNRTKDELKTMPAYDKKAETNKM